MTACWAWNCWDSSRCCWMSLCCCACTHTMACRACEIRDFSRVCWTIVTLCLMLSMLLKLLDERLGLLPNLHCRLDIIFEIQGNRRLLLHLLLLLYQFFFGFIHYWIFLFHFFLFIQLRFRLLFFIPLSRYSPLSNAWIWALAYNNKLSNSSFLCLHAPFTIKKNMTLRCSS